MGWQGCVAFSARMFVGGRRLFGSDVLHSWAGWQGYVWHLHPCVESQSTSISKLMLDVNLHTFLFVRRCSSSGVQPYGIAVLASISELMLDVNLHTFPFVSNS